MADRQLKELHLSLLVDSGIAEPGEKPEPSASAIHAVRRVTLAGEQGGGGEDAPHLAGKPYGFNNDSAGKNLAGRAIRRIWDEPLIEEIPGGPSVVLDEHAKVIGGDPQHISEVAPDAGRMPIEEGAPDYPPHMDSAPIPDETEASELEPEPHVVERYELALADSEASESCAAGVTVFQDQNSLLAFINQGGRVDTPSVSPSYSETAGDVAGAPGGVDAPDVWAEAEVEPSRAEMCEHTGALPDVALAAPEMAVHETHDVASLSDEDVAGEAAIELVDDALASTPMTNAGAEAVPGFDKSAETPASTAFPKVSEAPHSVLDPLPGSAAFGAVIIPNALAGGAIPLFQQGYRGEPARVETLEALGIGAARSWRPEDEDWHLPHGWEATILASLKRQLRGNRALRVFMEGCVRCGACADKCHFYLGTGDPLNMPVLRAELLRAVYRKNFTLAGRLLGRMGGGRALSPQVIKEWFQYFYQCTECRRCAIFCPLGIDTAEITMAVRELLLDLGLGLRWIMEPVRQSMVTGNHLGIQPPVFQEIVETLCGDIETITGVRITPPINEKGHEVLLVAPSGDLFAEPGIYTFMGYLMLLHASGLDYTLSTYASEGGNFGLFSSMALAAKMNEKLYEEAQRLEVRWILGGECGHMWRAAHQYMAVWNGPAPSGMETPYNPLTGTVFDHASGTKMLHIAEYAADLVHHGALTLKPERNNARVVTFHDACNTARGMGLLDEPREVLRAVCNHVVEMPDETIREKTFCCGSGGGLNGDDLLEMRLRGGLPRGHALRHVRDSAGVNTLACICAIDRAVLPDLADYWAPGVDVCGLHELLGNALVLPGEQKRTLDLRLNPLPEAVS